MQTAKNIRTFMEVSTQHLDKPSIDALTHAANNMQGQFASLSVDNVAYGFWCWVNEEPETMLKGNIPDVLYTIMVKALEAKAAYIFFDRDKEPADDLPIFDDDGNPVPEEFKDVETVQHLAKQLVERAKAVGMKPGEAMDIAALSYFNGAADAAEWGSNFPLADYIRMVVAVAIAKDGYAAVVEIANGDRQIAILRSN